MKSTSLWGLRRGGGAENLPGCSCAAIPLPGDWGCGGIPCTEREIFPTEGLALALAKGEEQEALS